MPFFVQARANPSTQQTNTNLVPAQANRSVHSESIYVSSDTAMTITLLNSESHTVLWRQYVGQRGGAVMPVKFLTKWGEGVDYSTSASGNVFILMEYSRVGSVG